MAVRTLRHLTIIFVAALVAGAVGCAKPKVQLQVSKDKIQQGEDVRVSWTSTDAKAVSINGEKVDKAGAKVYTPAATTTYTAVATRGNKDAKDSKTVSVSARALAPSVSISSDRDAIERGQSTTLRWRSTNADQVTISDLGAVPGSGSRVVSPSSSTTYTATAKGAGGTDSASTRVTVTEAAVVDPGARPRVTGSSATMASLFAQWVQPIYFDYDKADILPDSKDRLRRAAGWLTQGPNRSIEFRIEGGCDPRGTEEYNIGLGERRAQAAKELLVSLGVEAARIQTVSYGRERAAGDNEGAPEVVPSWAHDRRDDFIYLRGGTPPRT